MTDIAALLGEREKTHGDFRCVARLSAGIKLLMRDESPGWGKIDADAQEALDMIASKIGRILSGDPNCKDHWEDIAGYAQLIAGRL